MKNNSNGFSAIEATIILAVVAILGLGGWYVWNKNQKNDKTTNVTSNQQQPTADSQNTATNREKFLTAELNQTLGFKEAKLKFKLSADIQDAYFVTGNAGTAFSVHSLDDVAGCKATEQLGGAVLLAYDIGQGDQSSFKNDSNAVRMGQDWVALTTRNTDGCRSNDSSIQAKIDAVKKAFIDTSKTIVEVK